MKKKLSNSQKTVYWLVWATICSFLAWATLWSVLGIISLLR